MLKMCTSVAILCLSNALAFTAAAAPCLNVENQLRALATQPADTRVTVAVTSIKFAYEGDIGTFPYMQDLKKSHCRDAASSTVADLHLNVDDTFRQNGCNTVWLNGVEQPITDYSEKMLEITVRGQSTLPFKLIFDKVSDRHLLQSFEEMYNNGEESHLVDTVLDYRWGSEAASDDDLKNLTAPMCR